MEEGKNISVKSVDLSKLKVQCPTCKGEGEVSCATCKGQGRSEECSTCKGTGEIKCPSCEGSGMDYDQEPPVKCGHCSGKGKVKCHDCDGLGKMTCNDCHGEGKTVCKECGGSGKISIEKVLDDETVLDHKSGHVDADNLFERYEDVWDQLKQAANEGCAEAAYILLWCGEAYDEEDEEFIDQWARTAEGCVFGLQSKAYHVLFRAKQYQEASECFRKAADFGFTPAFGFLALFAHLGLGGQVADDERALELCRKYDTSKRDEFTDVGLGGMIEDFMANFPAAKFGNGVAMYDLASCLERIGNEDKEICGAAIKWYFKSWFSGCLAARAELVKMADEKGDEELKSKIALQDAKIAQEKALKVKNDQQRQDRNIKQQEGKTKTGKEGDPSKKRDATKGKVARWKFVLLGLLFGWFGAHYMYAKRWLMLLLTLGSFAAGVVMMNKSESNQKEVPVQTEQQTEGDASKGSSEAIGAVCFVLWLVMWLGGALFVKKDGKGNRM